MKHFYFLLFTCLSISLFSQKIVEKKFKLSNGRSKTVKIYLPKGYASDTISKFPLAIVLNNEYLFNIYKGNAQLFADADLAPRQIIVGVPTDQKKNQDVSFVAKTLGFTKNSKVFHSFIKDQLLSYMKVNYKTSPFITIAGEGEAANFLTYFLKENTPLFNSYISINPRFNEKTNEIINSYNLKRLDKVDNTYFFYTSTNPFVSKETSEAYNNLNTGLSSFENKNLKLKFDAFADSSDKLAAIGQSIPKALSHIFELYRNISKKEYDEKIKELNPEEAIKYLEERYINIEYLYGTNLNVRIQDIYKIEGIVFDKMDGDYLQVLGDFTMIKHPNSALGDYYMGKYHEIGKDYVAAESYYKTGYGKLDPSDPNADAYYQHIARITKLIESQPKAAPSNPTEQNNEEEQENNEDEEQNEEEKQNDEEKNDDGEDDDGK